MAARDIVLTLSGARPNNLPELVKDSVVKITFKAGVLGTLSSLTITQDPSGLTLGTPSTSGNNSTVTITASNTGRYVLTPSAVLSSGETIKNMVDVCIVEPNVQSTDY